MASVPSHCASLSSASMLARTLAKAREAPLCVPHFCVPRTTASCTRGSWSRPRKLSEPKLTTRTPLMSTVRSGRESSVTMSFMWVSGNCAAKCSMKRMSPFWRSAWTRCRMGRFVMPDLPQRGGAAPGVG